jgi:hypothetical protein
MLQSQMTNRLAGGTWVAVSLLQENENTPPHKRLKAMGDKNVKTLAEPKASLVLCT